MRTGLLRTALAGAVCLSLALMSPGVQADAFDFTSVTVKSGSGGVWDKYRIAHPAWGDGGVGHHRVTCKPWNSGTFNSMAEAGGCRYGNGHWATDFYNSEGQLVRYAATASGGTLSAKVFAVVPTCAANAAVAGWTVFVDVYVGNSWEGWVSYSHLQNVGLYVYPGLSIQPGQALGSLKLWAFRQKCWEVQTSGGVHTHIEMWNQYRYACYKGYQSPTNFGGSLDLGTIGRTIYGFVPSMC